MWKSILEQIDKEKNGAKDWKIDLLELKDSLDTWYLSDILSNKKKQDKLRKELNNSLDTDIVKSFISIMSKTLNDINKKDENDVLESREIKFKAFHTWFFDWVNIKTKEVKKLRRYKSTRNFMSLETQNTLKEKWLTEELSNKLDATWYSFIDSYGLEWISNADKKKLAVGVSFAFMNWYNENKQSKAEVKTEKKTPKKDFLWAGGNFLTKITKYSNSITSVFSWWGMDMLGWLIWWLWQYAGELPLDGFFKKIQNSVNIIKKNKGSVNKITDPADFVAFFEWVEDAKFLDNKEISNKYLESLIMNKDMSEEKKNKVLTDIANKNWEKFDANTLSLLTDVIKQAWPVLTMKKVWRSTVLGLYDQLQWIFSQVSWIAEALWMDFGSVKEFLKGLWPIGDMAFAVLWFNGVDWFIQDYWLEKLDGGLDNDQQNFVDYGVSYFRDNVNEYREAEIYKADWTKAAAFSEIDYAQTFHESDKCFFKKVWWIFTETIDWDKQTLTPTSFLGATTIYDKIPLSYKLVKDSIQKSFEENYPDEAFDDNWFETKIKEITKNMLSDPDLVYEFETNGDLGQDDFVAALCGSYILSVKWDKKKNPMDYAKAVAVWAVGYGYIKMDLKVEKENTDEVEESEYMVEKTSNLMFSELAVNEKIYINSIYDKIKGKKHIKAMWKAKFEKIAAKIFEEANSYSETQNIIPYIFAQIDIESWWWNIEAHNTTWEDSYGLMQINRDAHPDYNSDWDWKYNLEYWIRFLAKKIKQKWNIKDWFDQYNWWNEDDKTWNWSKDEDERYSAEVFERYQKTYLPEYFGKNNLDKLKWQKIENMWMLGNSHIWWLNYWWMFDKTYLTQWVAKTIDWDKILGRWQDLLWKNWWKISDLYVDWNVSGSLKVGVKDHINSKPAVKSMLLFFGWNEAWDEKVDYEENLKKLIFDIGEIDSEVKPILICSPLHDEMPNFEKRKKNNDITRKLAKNNKYPLFDFEKQFSKDEFWDVGVEVDLWSEVSTEVGPIEYEEPKKDVHLKSDWYKKMVKTIESSFVS